MTKYAVAFAALLAVSACGGDGTNPFDEDPVEEEDDSTDTGDTTDPGGIGGDRTLPPGSASPTPTSDIIRTEPTQADGGNVGDGFATNVSYNAADDTFTVDNLAFDGDNVYDRGTAVSSLGPYAVYEAKAQFPDSLTSNPINQFTHRAIYGISTSGNTQFAIVRTGAYRPYGFGGFVYQRTGGVTLPTTGQATYSGEISGIRDFNGIGGMQYSRANIQIAIDFEDFNDTTGLRGSGVDGLITNREIYDINGNNVTADVVDAINSDANAALTAIPAVTFTVGPGVLDANGEITGEVSSGFSDLNGNPVSFETGNYYAVMSGPNADEIVGVVVTETGVGQPDGVTVRDTGGFIVYR